MAQIVSKESNEFVCIELPKTIKKSYLHAFLARNCNKKDI